MRHSGKYKHALALYPDFGDSSAVRMIFPPTGLGYIVASMKEFVDNFVHFMDDAVNYRAEYATVLFNHQAFPLHGLGFLCGGCTSWLVDWLVNDTYGWTVIGNGIKMCREKLLNEARYSKK